MTNLRKFISVAYSICFGLILMAALPVWAADEGAAVNGITLGSSLPDFKMQVKKANISGLKRISDADDSGESYTTNSIKIGNVSWHPEFEFVKDKDVQRLACIVGAISKDEYSAVLNELSQKYGKPHPDCNGAAWDFGKGCKILLTGGTTSLHAKHRLEFTQSDLFNEGYQGKFLTGPTTPGWYYKWFLGENRENCETLNGIALNWSFEDFKKQLNKANIPGLKTINAPDGCSASYKTYGIKIGAVNWHPEFLFINDSGKYRLVSVAGTVAPGEYSAVLNELSRQFGRPHIAKEDSPIPESPGDYDWNLGKACYISLSHGHKFHNHDHLEFTDGALWEETIHGGCSPKWYDKWFELP